MQSTQFHLFSSHLSPEQFHKALTCVHIIFEDSSGRGNHLRVGVEVGEKVGVGVRLVVLVLGTGRMRR